MIAARHSGGSSTEMQPFCPGEGSWHRPWFAVILIGVFRVR